MASQLMFRAHHLVRAELLPYNRAMNFYCIAKTSNFIYPTAAETVKITLDLLKKSCNKKDVNFNLIESQNAPKELPKIAPNDMIYRVTMDKNAVEIEKNLMQSGCQSFYKDNKYTTHLHDNELLQKEYNLPIIKTVYEVTSDRSKLREHVDYLGGFPVVLKALGKTHGVGVMRLDSFESLASVLDYIESVGRHKLVLQEFVDHEVQARLIVLGGEVIASHENKVVKGDFRTNAGGDDVRERKVRDFEPEVCDAAIAAVGFLDLEFGGVDVLIDKSGKAHIAEVNFPCFFGRTQMLTEIDISGMMLDFLMQK